MARAETQVRALDDVSLDIARGEFTAIMGPSGSGKSTLMHCAAGLDTRHRRRGLRRRRRHWASLNDKALTLLRRDRIGFVFQSFNLVPTLTAEENILLPLAIAGRRPERGLVRHGDRDRRPRATGSRTGRASSPAASSSGSPAPGR